MALAARAAAAARLACVEGPGPSMLGCLDFWRMATAKKLCLASNLDPEGALTGQGGIGKW